MTPEAWWPVHGDLVRWAREGQRMSRAGVERRGGPNRRTLAFVRGQVPPYHEQPGELQGKAVEAAMLAAADWERWQRMGALERAREMLRLVVAACPQFPPVVLAHIMSLCPETMNQLLAGTHPLGKYHVEVLSGLTDLPFKFFSHGWNLGRGEVGGVGLT